MATVTYVPSRIGEGFFTDFQTPAAGSTDNGKAWAWNSGMAKFEPVSFFAASGVSSYGATLVSSANAAAARSTLGVVIGTDVQAYDAELAALLVLLLAVMIAYQEEIRTMAKGKGKSGGKGGKGGKKC